MRAAIIFLSFFCSSVSVSTATTCDIFAAGGTPCVAAHSTVRALYASFAGPLYQLKLSNGKTMDIKPVAPGGLADGKTHEAFCASGESSSKCVFSVIYDQSENQNHLGTAPPGGAHHQADINADAMQGAVMVGGVRVYGVRMDPPSGYRNDTGTGVARGDEAETIYAVLNGSVSFLGFCLVVVVAVVVLAISSVIPFGLSGMHAYPCMSSFLCVDVCVVSIRELLLYYFIKCRFFFLPFLLS